MKDKFRKVLFKLPGFKGLLKRIEQIESQQKVYNKMLGDIPRVNNESELNRLSNEVLSLKINSSIIQKELRLLRVNQSESKSIDDLSLNITVSVVIDVRKSYSKSELDRISNSVEKASVSEVFILAEERAYLEEDLYTECEVTRYNIEKDFADALNKVMEKCTGKYIVYLNEGVELISKWDSYVFAEFIKDKKLGCISAEILYGKTIFGRGENRYFGQLYSSGMDLSFKIKEKAFPRLFLNNLTCEYISNFAEVICTPVDFFVFNKDVLTNVSFNDLLYGDLCLVDFNLNLIKNGYVNKLINYPLAYTDCRFVKSFSDDDIYLLSLKWGRFVAEYKIKKIIGKQADHIEDMGVDVAIVVDSEDIIFSNQIVNDISNISSIFNNNASIIILNDRELADVTHGYLVLFDLRKTHEIPDRVLAPLQIKVSDNFSEFEKYYFDICANVSDDKNAACDMQNRIIEWTRDQSDKTINIFIGAPLTGNFVHWGDVYFAEGIKKEFDNAGYDAKIIPFEKWISAKKSKYNIILRGIKPYYRDVYNNISFMWNISHPNDINASEYNQYDHVFVASNTLAGKLASDSKVTVPVSVLLQCTDLNSISFETEKVKYDLLFVGNTRGVYRQIINDVEDLPYKLTIIGQGWDGTPAKEKVICDFVPNNELGQLYHNSKIVLNDHWDDMRKYGFVSNRLFDIVAADAFVISDYMPEIKEIFGDRVETYRSKEELHEKIKYYIENDEQRISKTEGGRDFIYNEHTFANRVKEIIEIMRMN